MPELDVTKIRAYGDIKGRVVTAPIGGAVAPTSPYPTAWGVGWSHLGLLSDKGVTENFGKSEKKIYAWQGSQLARVLRTQFEQPFDIECLETNPVVLGLKYPGAVVSTSGGTSEVQTLTITGTPTGGTFTLSFRGATTATIAYNATAAAVQAALEALPTIGTGNVTGSGGPLPGTAVVLTFAGALAKQDVPPILVASSTFTGGTSPTATIAITTGGVNATNTWGTAPSTAQNLRQFGIDLVDGGIYTRLYLPNAEAIRDGDITDSGEEVAMAKFKIYPYPDASGQPIYVITNDPAYQAGLFT